MASPYDEPQEGGVGTPEKAPLQLSYDVKEAGTCVRHVVVTVPEGEVQRYLDEAYAELVPRAEVPGFRPGRAPRRLVERRFRDQVREQVKGALIADALTQLMENQAFAAISEPDLDVDAVTLPEEGDFVFEFDVEVRPDFQTPTWRGLNLARPQRPVTDEDVQRMLGRLRQNLGTRVERQGGAQKGDQIRFDLTVLHDGEVIAECKDLEATLAGQLLLQDTVVDGFDRLMEGVTPGQTRETKATISEFVEGSALAGKEVQLRFHVHSVTGLQPHPLDEEFFDIFGVEDESELRDLIRQELAQRYAYQQRQAIRRQITEQLTKDADWDLPPDLVRRQSNRELVRLALEMEAHGYSREEIAAELNRARQAIVQRTIEALKEHFIFEKIAEEEGIDATEEDYQAEIARIARQRNESPRRVRARLEKRGQMDALRNQIIERKVVDLICEHAHFTDVVSEPGVGEDTSSGPELSALDISASGRRGSHEIPEAKHDEEARPIRSAPERI